MFDRCPICQISSYECFKIDSFSILQCLSCKHQFLSQSAPFESYDINYFTQGGAGYTNYLASKDLLIERGKWYAKALYPYIKHGSLLDVGAAAGFFALGFKERGWDVVGLEPNSEMVTVAKENIATMQGFFEEVSLCQKFMLISFIQIISHFHDLEKVMLKANKATHDHGYLLIETWIRDSLTAKIFGKRWHEYSPPSVRHWFCKQGVIDLAYRFGWTLISQGRPQKRIKGDHARSLLKSKLKNKFLKSACNWIPSNLTIPYPGDDVAYFLFQKKSCY